MPYFATVHGYFTSGLGRSYFLRTMPMPVLNSLWLVCGERSQEGLLKSENNIGCNDEFFKDK